MKAIKAAALAAILAAPAGATSVTVTITNNEDNPSGLFLTPFLNVFHSGDYQAFTSGQAASAGLETLAELGGTGGAAAEALAGGAGRQAVTLTEPTGVGPSVGAPPIFDPGNSASFTIHLDPLANRNVTLLSMIIPSNDTFISSTFELFDDMGAFTGGVFNLGRSNVYDAGTEVNRSDGFGQAFNTADGDGPGTLGEDENGVVHLSSDAELATLFGQPIPPLSGGFNSGDLTSFDDLVTVSFELAPVPLPASSAMLIAGLGLGGFMMRRRAAKTSAPS